MRCLPRRFRSNWLWGVACVIGEIFLPSVRETNLGRRLTCIERIRRRICQFPKWANWLTGSLWVRQYTDFNEATYASETHTKTQGPFVIRYIICFAERVGNDAKHACNRFSVPFRRGKTQYAKASNGDKDIPSALPEAGNSTMNCSGTSPWVSNFSWIKKPAQDISGCHRSGETRWSGHTMKE